MTRTSPHSVEAERSVLGSLMVDPDALVDVREAGLRAVDFYRAEHGALFALLLAMADAGEPIDPTVSVPDRLMRSGKPERFGGLAYVVELPDGLPATVNVRGHAALVQDLAARRQVLAALERWGELASMAESADALVEALTTDLGAFRRPGLARGVWVAESVTRHLDESQRIADGGRRFIPTRFTELDRLLKIEPGDLMVLAARPGQGKSAFALNVLLRCALDGDTVGLFSMEMSERQLIDRLLCTRSGIGLDRVRIPGIWTPEEWDVLTACEEEIRGLNIIVDYTPALTLETLAREARRWVHLHGCTLIVVDYLQLMRGIDRRTPREQQVSEISAGLKALAKDLGVPVIALAQLNRGVETRADPMPKPSDLRESGAIEQDADVIVFIHRPVKYDRSKPRRLAQIVVAKQRQGATGIVDLEWWGRVQLFKDWPPPKPPERPSPSSGERQDDQLKLDKAGDGPATGGKEST